VPWARWCRRSARSTPRRSSGRFATPKRALHRRGGRRNLAARARRGTSSRGSRIPRGARAGRDRRKSLRWAIKGPIDARRTPTARFDVCRARAAHVPRDVDATIDARPTSLAPLAPPSARGRTVPRAPRRAIVGLGPAGARGRNAPRAIEAMSARTRNVPREIGTRSAALGHRSDRGTLLPREIGTRSGRGMSVRGEIGGSWRTGGRKIAYFRSRTDRLASGAGAGKRRSHARRTASGSRSMGGTRRAHSCARRGASRHIAGGVC